jgi:hypothetical protein
VSDTSFEPEPLVTLARIELLQGILPQGELSAEASQQRRSLYDSFGTPEDPWVDKARAAYAAMSEVGGFVASVGDQLCCELDIRENAEMYAAVGGFEVSEITHGLGAWWSPSGTWFHSGPALAESALLTDPAFEDFPALSRLLLDASANNLASFFARVAAGGLRLATAGARVPWTRRRRRQFLLMAEVARARGLLFRDGPHADGRYLGEEQVEVKDLVEVVRRPRTASETGPGTEAAPSA